MKDTKTKKYIMKNYNFKLFGIINLLFVNLFSYATNETTIWNKADSIVANIKIPVFKNKIYTITDFGAKGDGNTDCTNAFTSAIQSCNKGGGGKVVVPQGKYLTGAIHLLSNVNLYLEEGSEILFSRDPQKYLPIVFTRFGGIELMNYSPFVYAYKQKNIAITGKGILNGQANDSTWWNWNGWGAGTKLQTKASNQLHKMAQKNIPVVERRFGDKHFLRPNFIQPYECKNVLIEGITLINSPAWILHPVLCENVLIKDVIINSIGPNNDGLDPESCNGVYIKGCTFRTGDDCIAIKSGKDYDGRRLNIPCKNIVIRDCNFEDGHGGICIGSEISGGVTNVFAENCTMNSPKLDRGIRIKSNSDRGGTIENIYIKNISIGEVRGAVIDIDMYYYDKEQTGRYLTKIKNIELEGINSLKSKYAIKILGSDSLPVENIKIKNCIFLSVQKENYIQGVKNLIITN